MKNLEEQLRQLVVECERLATTLEKYEPHHYLVQFDFDGTTEQENEEMQNRFFLLFGPCEMNRRAPTNEDNWFAFSEYKRRLQSVLPNVLAAHEQAELEFSDLISKSGIGISPDALCELVMACEDVCQVLAVYNDKHELLRFSRRYYSEEEAAPRTHLLVAEHYHPELRKTKRLPTLCELFAAFGQLHFDLRAAVAIEHAITTSRISKN